MKQEPETIFVVEDDEASRKLVRAIFRSKGYRIKEAEDIEGARALLADGVPSIVLLDIRLKGGDGLQLAREIRSNPAYRHVPLVAMTAHALKGDEERILAAGVDRYLAKPIDTRRLSGLVDELLRKGRGQGE